jgi:hypothetical protein
MNRKGTTPRRKRLNRQARLNSAIHWMKGYKGKNIIAGYTKWFGVGKICAINELRSIGVFIPDDLENQIRVSQKSRNEQKMKIREKRKIAGTMLNESDDNFAFIIGYTSGGFPYGLTHDEFKIIKSENMD